jgi:predicted CopG family antitoxin
VDRQKGGERERMSTKVKEAVIDMIQRMPEDTSVADIIAELYIRRKVDVGLQQLDSGQELEHAEVQQRMQRWLS